MPKAILYGNTAMTIRKKLKVLLIDDDEDDYIITRDMLASINTKIGQVEDVIFTLDWVYSYAEGWTALNKQAHDIYLIDYRMGKQSGLDLLRQALAQGHIKPIILLTGIEDRTIDIEAMQAGAADYLIKDQLTPTILERSIRYAIELSRREETVKRLLAQHKRLFEASQAMTSTLNLEEALNLIAEQMVKAVGARGCTISQWSKETNTVITRIEWREQWFNQPSYLGKIYSLAEYPLTRKVLEECVPITVNISDPAADPAEIALMEAVGSKTLLMLPLAINRRVIGLVELDETRYERTFSPEEIQLCQTLADQAAIAIENAQLYIDAEKRLKEQTALQQATAIFSSTLELDEVLKHIVQQLGQAIDVTSAYICDINVEARSSTVLAEYLSPRASAQEAITDLGRTYYFPDNFSQEFKAILAGQSEVIHLDDLNPAHFDFEHMKTYQAKSILFISLQAHGRTIAYAELWESEKKRHFSAEEISLCQSIAQQAAIALENARLYKQAQQEIIDRKKAEQALLQSEMELETLLNSISDYVWSADIIDGQVKYRYYSPIVEQITGYPVEYFMSGQQAWLDIIHPQDKSRIESGLKNGLPNQPATDEYRIIRPDGGVKWLRDTTSPTLNQAGQVIRLDGVVSDITERKKLELQLRQSQKMETIGTLAGGIAHDFNNILTPILGFTEMSLREVPPDTPQYKRLQHVYKATQRAKELVEQILTFSRNVEDDHVAVQLTLIIKEALTLIRATLPTTIEIKSHFNVKSGVIMGNPTQLHQVLVNLCTNAYHAMRETGGTIEIELTDVAVNNPMLVQSPNLGNGPYICLSVKDTGHGMDQTTLERIFEPFFTTKDIGEGTGLGLSVVHGIIVNHKGEILVESEPGAGSVFYIFFPAAQQSSQLEAPNEETIFPGKEHILFVDDEEAIAVMSKHMLESFGYTISITTSSAEALKLFSDKPDSFDLVITDQTMPQMTGLKLAQKLLELRPDLPIILTSGFSDVITPETVNQIGIQDYLLKPFNAQDLNKVIRNALT